MLCKWFFIVVCEDYTIYSNDLSQTKGPRIRPRHKKGKNAAEKTCMLTLEKGSEVTLMDFKVYLCFAPGLCRSLRGSSA